MNKSSNSNLKPFTPEYWEESYRSGDMGWDLGGPTPIFDQWIGTCKEQLVICILGAGNGWDAINFARRGHIVTAVDFAKLATTNMLITAKKNHVEFFRVTSGAKKTQNALKLLNTAVCLIHEKILLD